MAKNGIHKVTEDNIYHYVSGMGYSKLIVQQFAKSLGISDANYGKPARYDKDIELLLPYFNNTLGNSWNALTKWKKKLTLSNEVMEASKYPKSRMKMAIKDFRNHIDLHNKLFFIDETFHDEVHEWDEIMTTDDEFI